ncbi:MAG TPA: YeeE/YedE family protein [Dongiaceae bacterium]|nr:YeeE/YedE family protein [Dongiaceae bacterium]
MTIDWAQFTPWHSLIGGALIGLAASLLVLFNGRIAGVSGILSGIMQSGGAERWRWAFVVGLLTAPLLTSIGLALPQAAPVVPVPFSFSALASLLAAGFLVGLGTYLAKGCTSGHGVCGLARLSRRSLVAVLTFMTSAFVTVFLLRHVLGGGV